jgi:hypothetical protein
LFYRSLHAMADGDLTLAGTPQNQTLSGTVTIAQAEYTANFGLEGLLTGQGGGFDFGGFGASGGSSASAFPPVGLNVRVEARDSFIIRNEQVNTVAAALLDVSGTLAAPSVSGRVTFEGGAIRFRGQRYEITTGTLDLPAGFGATPQLNLQAESEIGGYRVYLGFTGAINDLELTLRSEPNLARTEILALMTTGRTEAGTLGSEELVRSGLGAAVSLLSEEFISQPVSRETKSLFGINRFQIDPVLRPNANPAARLTIGSQFARNFSFTYSTNLAAEQDQTVLVEYNLTNRFSALASFTQGGSATRQGSADNNFSLELRGRRRFSLGLDQSSASATGASGKAAGSDAEAASLFQRQPRPRAAVSVNQPEGVKIGESRLRELLPVMSEGFSHALARLGERNLSSYLQEQGWFFAEVRARCEPADCSGPNLRLIYDVSPGGTLQAERNAPGRNQSA